MPSRTAFAPASGTLASAPGTAARAADPHPEVTLHLLVPSPFQSPVVKVYSALCLPTAGKLTQWTSAVAHVYATTTGRLFITDRRSKRQFLVDTGSDLCVCPRRLIPRRKERVNYNLCAANGTTIHTDGCLSASTWVYVGISHGRSWWPTSHIPSSMCTSSLISASLWTAETTALLLCKSKKCPPI